MRAVARYRVNVCISESARECECEYMVSSFCCSNKLATESKVDELHVEGGVDHNVVELEVPVHNTLRWCVCVCYLMRISVCVC